jgi:uncharacterized protein DUF3810
MPTTGKRAIARAALIVIAAAAALTPLPAGAVERWYSRGFYPRLQAAITPVSNLIPFALFDIGIAAAMVATIVWLRRHRPFKIGRAAMALLAMLAAIYLLFLALWGFNYRRQPLEQKVMFDRSRVSPDAALRLASEAVRQANGLHAEAHRTAFNADALYRAATDVHRALGGGFAFEAGVPKPSALSWYFRKAAIDGMTDPFFLEVILNPDVLEFERPWVLSHEWGHLAGYAQESEANYFAWLTCARGDALARYSGWLVAFEHAAGVLDRERRRSLPPLEPGPIDDIRAMQARYRRSTRVVRNAARGIYDSYLRANRVSDGIANYSAVLQLMLGTELDPRGNPRLR